MTEFKAGFARIDITPPLGIEMCGYFETRIAKGVLDPLMATAIVIDDGKKRAAIVALDLIAMGDELYRKAAAVTAEYNQMDADAIFITCSHTHTGPVLEPLCGREKSDELYNELLMRKIRDVVALAAQDLKPVEIKTGLSEAKGISFIRRYKMKDGSTRTNPGVNNPDIDHPIGQPDESVQVVVMSQQGAGDIVMVNFQVHPDIIGGDFFSADYPKFVRDTIESVIPGARCMYINGTQGDTNHVNVHPPKTKREVKSMLAGIGEGGYWFSKNVGRTIAGAVLSIYEKLEPVCAGNIVYGKAFAKIQANKATPEDLKKARALVAIDAEGKFVTNTMEDVSALSEAYTQVMLADHDDFFMLQVSALMFGEVGLVCFPGEPFTEVGRQVKKASGLDKCFVSCCANGHNGYFPTQDDYDEGGYEARSSNFKPGVAEALIDTANSLVKKLHEQQ